MTRARLGLPLFAAAALVQALHGAPAATPSTIELREADSPFVAFNIWVKSGAAADPAGKEGLASLTAAMITGGATTQDKVQTILEKLYPIASGYSGSVDKEMSNFTGASTATTSRPTTPCSATRCSHRHSRKTTSTASRRSA
jgi:zinc protease